VIDCDIHPQIGNLEELLAHVETSQRDWFRGQPYFGLPGYSWSPEHTDGHDELLWEMLEAAGAPDVLCFASDYPHWDFDDPAFMLKRLPEAWRERVLRENAAALYGERLGLVPA
jgi:hypothetical protein